MDFIKFDYAAEVSGIAESVEIIDINDVAIQYGNLEILI